MKHILLSLMLLPAILFAQKSTSEKVIKLPIYNATLPVNEVWIDKVDSLDKVSITFENPNFEIEKFDLIIDYNGNIMRVGSISNQAKILAAYYISMADTPNTTITLHLDKIYLKGVLRTANWTYRIRVR